MPGTESKQPRPAWVEDWDEETQTADSSTRATANAAIKRSPAGRGSGPGHVSYIRDGSDSGYSSKAATIASISTNKTNGKKPRNLKVDTSVQERERQPYAMATTTKSAQHTADAPSTSWDRPGGVQHPHASANGQRFRHQPDVCWVCDKIGYHPDANELAKIKQLQTPTSVKPSKKPSRMDQEAQKKLRRQSLTRESRPALVYGPPAALNFYPVTPIYPPSSISAPISTQPQIPYVPEQLVYTSYPHVAPITPQYIVESNQIDYFIPQPVVGDLPVKSNRLSGSYDPPILHHTKCREEHTAKQVPGKEAHPDTRSRQPTRSAQQQRSDREAMPPPARHTQRPSRRSSSRDSAYYVIDGSDDRYSGRFELPRPTRHAQDPSPTRAPPSSYKHLEQNGGSGSRPPVRRKSVSYSVPMTTTQVATARPPLEASTSNRRRNTASSDKPASHDRQAANAQAYIERNSRLTSEQLTEEKIAEMKSSKPTGSSRSETGSTLSQHSHQSSSKSCSGHDRSHTRTRGTSILVDGVKIDIPQDVLNRKGRPVSMQLGDVNISVGNKKETTSTDKRDAKMIETAPSVASVRSKRSATDSTHSSSKVKGKLHRD